EWGLRRMQPLPDRYSDADPATVNDEPSLGDLEEDASSMLVGDYGIYSYGAQRVQEVCTAIANGIPVCCAIAGGSAAFQNSSGGVLGPLNAPLDHYVCIIGYETSADGSKVFMIRNSWSEYWGENGNVRINEACLDQLGDL